MTGELNTGSLIIRPAVEALVMKIAALIGWAVEVVAMKTVVLAGSAEEVLVSKWLL